MIDSHIGGKGELGTGSDSDGFGASPGLSSLIATQVV